MSEQDVEQSVRCQGAQTWDYPSRVWEEVEDTQGAYLQTDCTLVVAGRAAASGLAKGRCLAVDLRRFLAVACR